MWTLERIRIYPIKSLPGVDVSHCDILPAGNLRHDREFALIDGSGKYVNGKRTAEVHRIRAEWDLANWSVMLGRAGEMESERFHLDEDLPQLQEWFSDHFRMPIKIERKPEGGFPDDTEASGPTIVGSATLQAVASWFPGLDVDEVRGRFRANLELGGGDPFGEDLLFGGPNELIPIQIGEARIWGNNPCQRCVVPTRNTTTGEIWAGFQKAFSTHREASLPTSANRQRFNHFYRLAVNTVVQQSAAQPIGVGDAVRVPFP